MVNLTIPRGEPVPPIGKKLAQVMNGIDVVLGRCRGLKSNSINMPKLEDIRKDAAVTGIEPEQVVRVVTTEPVGPNVLMI